MVKIMKAIIIGGLIRLNLMIVTFLVEFKTSIKKFEVMERSF
jgi:hypothetical protein